MNGTFAIKSFLFKHFKRFFNCCKKNKTMKICVFNFLYFDGRYIIAIIRKMCTIFFQLFNIIYKDSKFRIHIGVTFEWDSCKKYDKTIDYIWLNVNFTIFNSHARSKYFKKCKSTKKCRGTALENLLLLYKNLYQFV